ITVMSVNMKCYKCKRVALQSVTRIDGIDSISIDMKEKTLTVVGEADPADLVKEITKKFPCARLISFGPPPPPSPPPPSPPPPEPPLPRENNAVICYPAYPPAYHCGCSSREDILWPRCNPPWAPPNEVWYVWNEENQSSCTIS
ncbi:hypothetical protein KI387_024554, partial [Taxus chinensis]